MSAEPDLVPDLLLEMLWQNYGLRLENATFLSDGTAPAYRVEGSGGRFFVKLLPDTPYGRATTARIRAEIPLLWVLREEQILTRISQPLPTLDGSDLAEVEGYSLAVYGWIEAMNLASDWEDALPELAPLLGRLHAGTPRLMGRLNALPTPPEDFELPFEAELRADLQHLRELGRGARPSLHELHDLLSPHHEQIQRLLTRVQEYQQTARTQTHKFVVCHTDAHSGNVMRDAAGELWIIDWETARLAPREHDLWMLHARLPEILPAYEAVLGRAVNLNLDLLAFDSPKPLGMSHAL